MLSILSSVGFQARVLHYTREAGICNINKWPLDSVLFVFYIHNPIMFKARSKLLLNFMAQGGYLNIKAGCRHTCLLRKLAT